MLLREKKKFTILGRSRPYAFTNQPKLAMFRLVKRTEMVERERMRKRSRRGNLALVNDHGFGGPVSGSPCGGVSEGEDEGAGSGIVGGAGRHGTSEERARRIEGDDGGRRRELLHVAPQDRRHFLVLH